MRLVRSWALIVLLCGAPSWAAAQQAQPASDPPQVNVDNLPLDVGRIQRGLRQSTERQQRDGLNIRFQIEVFGQAPPLQLFASDEDLTTGPVPYGAPTHQEMLDFMTPKKFSSPVMDFGALFKWLGEKSR